MTCSLTIHCKRIIEQLIWLPYKEPWEMPPDVLANTGVLSNREDMLICVGHLLISGCTLGVQTQAMTTLDWQSEHVKLQDSSMTSPILGFVHLLLMARKQIFFVLAGSWQKGCLFVQTGTQGPFTPTSGSGGCYKTCTDQCKTFCKFQWFVAKMLWSSPPVRR